MMLKISFTAPRFCQQKFSTKIRRCSFERSVHIRSGDLYFKSTKNNTNSPVSHFLVTGQKHQTQIQSNAVAPKFRVFCTQTDSDQQEQALSQQQIPTEALTLGVAGLIPFVSGAVGVLSLPIAWGGYVAFLQMTYGASILSFLGAVHWGFAATKYTSSQDIIRTNTHNWMQYGFGVVPSLISWASLTQSPLEGMALLLAGHTLALLGDLYAAKRGLTPSWYPRLRFPLYLGAMASLGATFIKVL